MIKNTVADRIRRMTDDELNSFLQELVDGQLTYFDDLFCKKICPHRTGKSGCDLGDADCDSLGWNAKEAIRLFLEADARVLGEKEDGT